MRKYSSKDLVVGAKLQPNMFDHMHMKLFRAQRNLYISGFSVFLWLWVCLLDLNFNQVRTGISPKDFCFFCRVMKRLITLINQLASASATTAALQEQAANANQTAEKYMKDNELLKQVNSTRVTPLPLFLYLLYYSQPSFSNKINKKCTHLLFLLLEAAQHWIRLIFYLGTFFGFCFIVQFWHDIHHYNCISFVNYDKNYSQSITQLLTWDG